MKFNGIDVIPVVHEVSDEQAIKTYLESVNEDVLAIDITPYAKEPNVIRYLIVIFVKVV